MRLPQSVSEYASNGWFPVLRELPSPPQSRRSRGFTILLFALLSLTATALAQVPSTISLTIASIGLAGNTVNQGNLVTLTATVTAAGPVSPGQVNFCEVKPTPPLSCADIHLLATKQLIGGLATFSFYPPPGPHTYQAVFLGTHAANAGLSAQLSLTVTPLSPTATTLSGQTVTVNARRGNGPMTGTAIFIDVDNAGYVLGSATLNSYAPRGPGLSFAGITTIPRAQATPPLSDTGAASIATGDFNNDGSPDVALGVVPPSPPVSPPLDTLATVLGNATSGTFGSPFIYPVTDTVSSIHVADFNSDGKQDLLINTGTQLEVLLGNGDGSFAHPGLYTSLPGQVAVGDFNRDGLPDLAVLIPAGTVNIYLGNFNGTFTAGPVYSSGGSKPTAIAAANFYSDGNLDLAIVDRGGTVTVLLGNGDGTFTPGPVSPLPVIQPDFVAAADFVGNGLMDLVVSSASVANGTKAIGVLWGRGDGSFTPATQGPMDGLSPVVVGDFNGDGIADLVTLTADGTSVQVFLGNGNGSFQPAMRIVGVGATAPPGGAPFSGIAAADFNGDGLSDLALSLAINGRAYIVPAQLSPQAATGTLTTLFIVGTGQHNVEAVYSGDGNYQTSTSAPFLWKAQLEPTTVGVTTAPSSSPYGQQVMLTATVSASDPQNHIPTGDMTFTYAGASLGKASVIGGVAMLYVTSLPVGTDTVTATYSGDMNFASGTGSGTQVVTAYPSTTVLTAAPNPGYGGQAITLTATVAGVGTTITPTGTVTFYDGTTVLGSATVDPIKHANFTTSALTVGVHSLTAVYSPYSNSPDTASTSPAITENVLESEFSITLPNPIITLAKYQHTTTAITLASFGAFSDSVTVTCGGTLPVYLTCLPSPTSTQMTPDGSASVSLYLDTDSDLGGRNGPVSAHNNPPASPLNLALLLSPVSLIAALAARRRRLFNRRLTSPFLLLLLTVLPLPMLFAITSCGGNIITPIPATAPGTYTIPITATGATTGLTHTVQLTLIVTP